MAYVQLHGKGFSFKPTAQYSLLRGTLTPGDVDAFTLLTQTFYTGGRTTPKTELMSYGVDAPPGATGFALFTAQATTWELVIVQPIPLPATGLMLAGALLLFAHPRLRKHHVAA